jgi:ABC-type uncharacterized transport system permease subunit
MTNIFSLTAMLLYAGAWTALLRALSADETRGRTGAFDGLLGYLAVMAHGLVLIPALFLDGRPDLALGSTLSLIALIIAVLFLAARLFQPIQSLGVLIFPSAFAGVAFGWLLPGPTYAAKLHGVTGLFHLLGAGLAYALLSLALAQALLLHFHDRELKQKRAGGFFKSFPPIQTMERILFQLVYLGFGLLTLTLFSGALSSGQMFGQALLFNHHTILALLAWISLAVLVLGRLLLGWRGRTAVLWTGLGFSLLAAGYFGTRFVLEILLTS